MTLKFTVMINFVVLICVIYFADFSAVADCEFLLKFLVMNNQIKISQYLGFTA